MKKLFILLLTAILTLGSFPTTNTYAVPEDYIDGFMIWTIHPVDYPGEYGIYIHSNHNPEGEYYDSSKEVYRNEEWVLHKFDLSSVREAPDTYWVTVSTDSDGEFFPGYITGAFPDLERRSVLPNIDTSVTTKKCEDSLGDMVDETGWTGLDEYLIPWVRNAQGIDQFFCIIDHEDSFNNSIKNINNIFETLFVEYATTVADMVNAEYPGDTDLISYLLSHYFGTKLTVVAGHFDDYYTLFYPFGVTYAEYAMNTKNEILQCFCEEFQDGVTLNGVIFRDYVKEEVRLSHEPTILLKNNYGWEIYYDASDEAAQNYNYETSRFYFGDNVVVPAIDGTYIPEDTTFPVIGDFSITGLVPEKVDDVIETPVTSIPKEPDNVDYINKIPSEKEETQTQPTKAPTQPNTPVVEEPSSINPIIPIIIIAVVVLGGVVVVIFLKKSK